LLFDDSKVFDAHTAVKLNRTECPFRDDEWRKTGEGL